MKERILHVSVSSILLFVSFFLGHTFAKEYANQTLQETLNKQYRVDLTLSGKTLHIKKDTPTISIYLNGEKIDQNKQITLSK